MRKEIYLVRGNKKEDYRAFTHRMINTAHETSKLFNPETLKVSLTTQSPPLISVIPFKKSKMAVFSLYREDHTPVSTLHSADGFFGAFRVDEVLPVAYEKTWPDGEPTPGACLLTLFNRKPGIAYDDFLDRWHNGHTPLSLKIHPLWNYNRNVVLQKLCDESGWYDGIVEENTRTRKDLLNPFKFFGNGLVIASNMMSVYKDVRSFLDYQTIETYLVTEFHIKSRRDFYSEVISQSQTNNYQTHAV
jgi:hypothetical protein